MPGEGHSLWTGSIPLIQPMGPDEFDTPVIEGQKQEWHKVEQNDVEVPSNPMGLRFQYYPISKRLIRPQQNQAAFVNILCASYWCSDFSN
ncbi:hypothetical protein Y1Q_0021252 [Alligator mississippiensis]|uniref:Uncharacterized protein n=1 Tax=Alligator mississippiensis TaxID=8496 RepID=A0A151MS24_ALLMI|nr:hypothetical protein Y1Q_0021252 [Alligator mississippiensis]